MLNNFSIVGRIKNDLELKEAESGKVFSVVTLEVIRSHRDSKTGKYGKDEVDITVYGFPARNLVKYAGEQSLISIKGCVVNKLIERTIELIGERVSFIQVKAPRNSKLESESVSISRNQRVKEGLER